MRQNRHGIDRTQFDAARELDEVIPPYAPHAGERWTVRYGRWLVRAVVALCLAIAAAAAIALILDRHMRQAETQPKPKRPVTVNIVPAK